MNGKTSRKLILSDKSAFSINTTPINSSIAVQCRKIIPLHSLTINITQTYKACNPEFRTLNKLPRRILTQPSEGVYNNGLDNEDSNLICRVHDILECSTTKYTILDLLGTGTFGQVFRCQKDGTKEVVAIKIIKNKPAYHTQGQLEAKIAKLLNQKFDPNDDRYIVRLQDYFECRGHICLVFELLSMSLLDILTQNQFRGLPLNVVQRFTRQILTALVTLQEAEVIHCDLKPENILLSPNKTTPQSSSSIHDDHMKNICSSTEFNLIGSGLSGFSSNHSNPLLSSLSSSLDRAVLPTVPEAFSVASSGATTYATSDSIPSVTNRTAMWSDLKVIDLGSACFEGQTLYSYIQSRFYRSPEVLLGVPYNGAIDMWSLACVCAEMYLGLPLFPGVSQHNQLTRIVDMFGPPPDFLIDGKNGMKYFTYIGNTSKDSNTMDDDDFELSRQQPAQHRGVGTPNIPVNINNSFLGISHHSSHHSTHSTAAKVKPSKYRLKTAEEYARETKTEVPILKKYLRYSRLEDVVLKYPLANRSRLTTEQKREEIVRRHCFLNFLQGLFSMDPFQRWTAKQAMNHPFITNAPYTAPYIPAADSKTNDRKLAYLLQLQSRHDTGRSARPPIGSALKSMTIKPQPVVTSSAQAIANLEAICESPPNYQVFLPLERHASEPAIMQDESTTKGQSYSTGEINHFLMNFEARPRLQRGKPVVPEKSTQSDKEYSITGVSSDSVSDMDSSVTVIYPPKNKSNPQDLKKISYTPTESYQGLIMQQPYQQQIQIQQEHLFVRQQKQGAAFTYADNKFPSFGNILNQQQQLHHNVQQQHQDVQLQQQEFQHQQQLFDHQKMLHYQKQHQKQQEQFQQQLAYSTTHPPELTRHLSFESRGVIQSQSTNNFLMNIKNSTSTESSPNFAVGSLPGQSSMLNDFGQALLRPDMDEQRYFHSQRQLHSNQEQPMQNPQRNQYQFYNQFQNKPHGSNGSIGGLTLSNHGLREKRMSSGSATLTVGSPQSVAKKPISGSFEKPKNNVFSSVMSGFRPYDKSSRDRGQSLQGEDELNQSRHGDLGTISYMGGLPLPSSLQANTARFDDDRIFTGNLSSHSNFSDGGLNVSAHSASSIGSDFPIVNRQDVLTELEIMRMGEREIMKRNQASEVERHERNSTVSGYWPFNTFGSSKRAPYGSMVTLPKQSLVTARNSLRQQSSSSGRSKIINSEFTNSELESTTSVIASGSSDETIPLESIMLLAKSLDSVECSGKAKKSSPEQSDTAIMHGKSATDPDSDPFFASDI